ncbi:MAG: hypothetical protein ACXVB9_09195 [Bdellovibrionota bacterium]
MKRPLACLQLILVPIFGLIASHSAQAGVTYTLDDVTIYVGVNFVKVSSGQDSQMFSYATSQSPLNLLYGSDNTTTIKSVTEAADPDSSGQNCVTVIQHSHTTNAWGIWSNTYPSFKFCPNFAIDRFLSDAPIDTNKAGPDTNFLVVAALGHALGGSADSFFDRVSDFGLVKRTHRYIDVKADSK